jgi:hypothetical protein
MQDYRCLVNDKECDHLYRLCIASSSTKSGGDGTSDPRPEPILTTAQVTVALIVTFLSNVVGRAYTPPEGRKLLR